MAYNHGDLGQVYPIARGSAPLLVTLGAALFIGEVLDSIPLFGVILLAIGVMAFAFDRQTGFARNPRAVLFALGTGVCIASYTLVDGLGARHAGSVMGFAVCLTIGDGALTSLIAMLWKREAIGRAVKANRTSVMLAGGMQVAAYWIAVWALAHAPLGMVSALQETSVLFAALISGLRCLALRLCTSDRWRHRSDALQAIGKNRRSRTSLGPRIQSSGLNRQESVSLLPDEPSERPGIPPKAA